MRKLKSKSVVLTVCLNIFVRGCDNQMQRNGRIRCLGRRAVARDRTCALLRPVIRVS